MKTIITFFLTLSTLISIAQVNSTYPNIPYTEFKSVDIIDDYIIAIGSCDQIWSSVDGGATWSHIEIFNLVNANTTLIPSDPSKALFLTNNTIVLYDLTNQQIINTYIDNSFGIGFGNTLMAKGENLYLLTSQGLYNSSMTDWEWELVFEKPVESTGLRSSDITESYIFICSDNGLIYRYNINDNTASLRSDNTNRISELSMGTDNIGYAIINGMTKVQKTEDGGETFVSMEELNINRNVHAYGSNMVATILGYSLSVSVDGGITVEDYSMSNTSSFGDISNGFIGTDGTIYAYGNGSTIAKTTDLGESFQFIHPYNRSDLSDVVIYEDGYGLISGEHGTIIQTTDNGQSWSPIDFGIDSEDYLYTIDRLSNGNIITGGQDGIFVIENNQVIHTEATECYDILVTQNGSIIAHTYSDGMYQAIRSTDGGINWTTVQSDLTYTQHIQQSNTGKIYITTQTQDVYLSEDDGANWSVQDYGIVFRQIFPYNDQIIMGLEGNSLIRSEDGGETWNTISSNYLLDNLVYVNESEFYITYGQNGETRLLHTNDAGESWDEEFRNCTFTLAMTMNSVGDIIMAQASGHINVYSEEIINSTDNNITIDPPLHIWPNPIDKNMTLHIDSPWSTLQIVNLKGDVLSNFTNYKSSLDISMLESGLYIIKLEQDGRVKTEKLIVL